MLYPNFDTFSSTLGLQQPNPWSNAGVAQGNAALQSWQQAAQQLPHHQLLAQQLAAQNAFQSLANGHLRSAGPTGNPATGLPLNLAPLSLTMQHIAQSLHALALQLTQLTAQASLAGLNGNAQSNQFFATPPSQQYAPIGQAFAQLGQVYPSGLALH
jgi:hypothetical protein